MTKNNQLFISHSTPASTEIGNYVSSALKKFFKNEFSTWISDDVYQLSMGQEMNERIVEAASESSMMLSVLTPENYKRPWMLFEPGMFYVRKFPVLVLLCGGLTYQKLASEGYPNFTNSADCDLGGLKKLTKSINGILKKPVDDETIEGMAGTYFQPAIQRNQKLVNDLKEKSEETKFLSKVAGIDFS